MWNLLRLPRRLLLRSDYRRYAWPANIRELQNVIERSVVIYQKGNLSVKKSWLCCDYSQAGPAAQPLLRRSAIEDRKLIGAALAEAKGRISGRCSR